MAEIVVRALHRLNTERGQALAEYSLILAFIAAACALSLGFLGLAIAGHLEAFATAFP
jgi:Flp pilus assembly pilin Flp